MAINKFTSAKFRPMHIRDTFMFERGNVAGFATVGGETGVNAPIGPNSNPGGAPDVPFVIGVFHAFGDSNLSASGAGVTQPGNIRAIDSELLFNSGTSANAATVSVTSGQSIAAIRGAINVAQYTSIAQGYLYGVQGKVVVQGTINVGSAFTAALFGQYDTSGSAAVLTSGYNAALVLDMGATSYLASSTVLDAVDILNTTGCLINSVVRVVANASYFMDLTDLAGGGAHWAVAKTAQTNAAMSLKIKVGGTDFYIPLSATAV